MTQKVELSKLSTVMQQRIQERLAAFQPHDPRFRATMSRIGFLLETQIKENIRRKKIIDQGGLLNSIRFEIFQEGTRAGVRVGSFGVPYAAIHEFGGQWTPQMRRAMFAKLRKSGRLKESRNKNVVQNSRIIARPYLRPAVEKHRTRVIQMLRDLLQGRR